jgi:hypothetical protein
MKTLLRLDETGLWLAEAEIARLSSRALLGPDHSFRIVGELEELASDVNEMIGRHPVNRDGLQLLRDFNAPPSRTGKSPMNAVKGERLERETATGVDHGAVLESAVDILVAIKGERLVLKAPLFVAHTSSAPVVVRTNTVAGRGAVTSRSPEGPAA